MRDKIKGKKNQSYINIFGSPENEEFDIYIMIYSGIDWSIKCKRQNSVLKYLIHASVCSVHMLSVFLYKYRCIHI